VLKLCSAVLRTAVIGKLSSEWPQAPFILASAEIFPGGQRRHFAYNFQVADNAMLTDVHAKRTDVQTCTSLAAIARYIAISYKIDKLQIFQAEYLFTKNQIAVVFSKTTILSLFYLARLASITQQKELQTSKIPSKAIKHPFNKSLLAFTDVFMVNAHPHKPHKRSVSH